MLCSVLELGSSVFFFASPHVYIYAYVIYCLLDRRCASTERPREFVQLLQKQRKSCLRRRSGSRKELVAAEREVKRKQAPETRAHGRFKKQTFRSGSGVEREKEA
jgi:hypothetical protein